MHDEKTNADWGPGRVWCGKRAADCVCVSRVYSLAEFGQVRNCCRYCYTRVFIPHPRSFVTLQIDSNYKPFLEDEDDRLAQVEALQILFTLQIGLVLQLQAASKASGEESAFDPAALDVLLIMLNSVVIVLALIQQPIVRKVWGKITSKCSSYREKCRHARKETAEDEMKGFTNNPMSVVKRKKKDGEEALAQAAANNETPQDVHNEGTTENAQLRAKVSQLIQAQLAAGADHKRIVLKNAQLMADIKMLKQAQVGVAAGAAVDAADLPSSRRRRRRSTPRRDPAAATTPTLRPPPASTPASPRRRPRSARSRRPSPAAGGSSAQVPSHRYCLRRHS